MEGAQILCAIPWLTKSIPISPITAGIDVEGDRSIATIAALQCGPHTRECLTIGIADLKTWGKENAKYILEKEPSTKDHGFFIVNATRKTKWCKILCTSAYSGSISPGFSVGVPSAGSVDASVNVSKDEKISPGWIERKADGDKVSASF
jgi:hypothetical protein